ncbi:hypothetical protein UlMin_034891 [Ulmus minor]
MAASCMVFQVSCSVQESSSIQENYENLKTTFSSTLKQPLSRALQQVPNIRIDVPQTIKNASVKLLDAFVDSVFEFEDQPLLPSQSNLAPVDELGEPVVIANIEGNIPHNFPAGVYVRNGPNPLFGGLKSTKSMFGITSHTWIEGEGMLHALYFIKDKESSNWTVCYNSKHVQTETFNLEKQRNKPSFLPAIEGNSPAILSAYLFNMLRFGKVNKYISNTNVFEHSGKFYSIAENHMPQEIDISTLETLGNWDLCPAWNRPFTSHPKIVPDTGELVTIGVNPIKPYLEIGVISADGKELVHKTDVGLSRCSLCHDFGITKRYNVIMDLPLTIDLMRLVRGGPLVKYNKEGYARIGVMPRYRDADSVTWFEVEPNCTFHILNCFEDGDEVVVWGCRCLDSIIPGPDKGTNKFEWFSRRFKFIDNPSKEKVDDESLLDLPYEWRLNMRTGEVRERNLTGKDFSMDFPMINSKFTGLKNSFGYAQVINSTASSTSGKPKYGGLAKLHFKQRGSEENTFCSGAAFVPAEGSLEEDDGWIITFVHNEDTDISHVLVIDANKFSSEPVAKITLPFRVPYGFHGAYFVQ